MQPFAVWHSRPIRRRDLLLPIPLAEIRLFGRGRFQMQLGYFRDDDPLCELILSEVEQRELDVLWQELNFIADVPRRQYQGYIWYEWNYINGPEFFGQTEDKDTASEQNVLRLADVYLDKAEQTGASELALNAIREHFFIYNSNIRRVELAKKSAEGAHLRALKEIAAKA